MLSRANTLQQRVGFVAGESSGSISSVEIKKRPIGPLHKEAREGGETLREGDAR